MEASELVLPVSDTGYLGNGEGGSVASKYCSAVYIGERTIREQEASE